MSQQAECPHLREAEHVRHCDLAKRMLGTQDLSLVRVSKQTCEVCSSFFVPSLNEPNQLVASLVCNAAETLGDERLQSWANHFLRTGLAPEPVAENGQVVRDRGMLCASHRKNKSPTLASRDEACIYLVRRKEESARLKNLGGWPYAHAALQPLHCRNGIVFDDFVEERFGYHMGSPGYREPWIGIFHHPLDDPGYVGRGMMLESMLATPYWKESEPYLQGAITLSRDLAGKLREKLKVPVVSVRHPVVIPEKKWTVQAYLSNPRKQFIQLGWYQRNTQAIYHVPPLPLQKLRLLPCGRRQEDYDRNIKADFVDHRQPRYSCRVTERVYLHPDEYESALTKNVVFCEMLAASANNIVVDCIAANTPLIINRHPAVLEYLGQDYPLYFDELGQIPELCRVERLAQASHYLEGLDKSWADAGTFRRSVSHAVREFLAGVAS